MITIYYKYKGLKGAFDCKLKEQIRDVCGKIASQINIDIDTMVIILNDEKINLKSKKTFEDIIVSNSPGRNEFQMQFFDDPEKIVKVIVHYQGETKEINAKREQDSLFNIFDRLKFNIQKMFLIEGGEAIQKEDLNKRLNDLKSIENEEGELNVLAYKMEDGFEQNDDNKNDIDNDEIKNNNINNNSELLINNSNDDNSNDKNSNEKIYIENNSNEKILNLNEDKKEIRYISVINNKHFFTKTFLTSKIEFSLIMAFTWLGCYLNINKVLNNSSATPWIFYFVSLVITFFSFFLMFEFSERSIEKKGKFFLISIIFYIPYMVFFCLILTQDIENKYILMILSLIIVNFLLLEIYHSFILSNEYLFLTFLPLLIANALLIILYAFLWMDKIRQIIIISIISFVIILYIIIICYQMKEYEEEEYMFGVFALSYGVFALYFFLCITIIGLLFFLIFNIIYIIICFIKYIYKRQCIKNKN